MLAAIYARKSTEQSGVADDQKSVARQVEHARQYAARKGWTVADEHVYVDDGISGAEFERRPGLQALLRTTKPSPPFGVLVVAEQKALGRESFETNFLVKQLARAGVEIVEYVHGRSLTPKNWIDKITTAVLSSVDEGHREQTRERVHETFLRKFRAGHVVGGRVFGYRNVDVIAGHDADGRPIRSHVERRINDDEAAIVRRIFVLSAEGHGVKAIAKLLNREGAPSPRPQRGRPQSWAPSSVHDVLFRDLYRGVATWNKSQKCSEAWGDKHQAARPAADWQERPDPTLAIVTAGDWKAAHARIDQARALYLQANNGRWF